MRVTIRYSNGEVETFDNRDTSLDRIDVCRLITNGHWIKLHNQSGKEVLLLTKHISTVIVE